MTADSYAWPELKCRCTGAPSECFVCAYGMLDCRDKRGWQCTRKLGHTGPCTLRAEESA